MSNQSNKQEPASNDLEFTDRMIAGGGFYVRLRVDWAGGSWAGSSVVTPNEVGLSGKKESIELAAKNLIRRARIKS